MRSSTLRALAGAAAIATLAAGAAAFTSGSAAHPVTGQARILHLVERGGGLKFVDNPPKAKHPYDFSAGDIVIVSRDLYDPTGSRAGTLRLVCVATDQTTEQCNGTETLTAGTLEVAGISAPAPSTTVAVIGGTGAYNGVRGTSSSQDRKTNNNVADQTITLQP
jgi:hypothetical protein